jgi:large subunit ribosomal protein L13
MKTFTAKAHEVKHDWYVVDAQDKVLGRLAATLAHRLRGKHKPEFTPHVDVGDYIVVVNVDKLRTGSKARKAYHRHSTHPAYLHQLLQLQAKHGGACSNAWSGMLPRAARLRDAEETQSLAREPLSARGATGENSK